MSLPAKQPRPKTCKNPACGEKFVAQRLGQSVCSYPCGLAIKEVNADKARKALADVGRKELRAAKERVKPKARYMHDCQQAFNAWVRARDAALPCVSCGRHHQGKYDAGHYRTVGSNPALRFEPMNCHRQCSPCNTRLSGNIVNYRIELVKRIGAEALEWLEGPHEAKKYTVDELKAMTADYRAKTKELKKREAA